MKMHKILHNTDQRTGQKHCANSVRITVHPWSFLVQIQ